MPSRLSLDADLPHQSALEAACDALRRDCIVAYPTDTLYGLAVDPRSNVAVERLYAAKERASDRGIPLIAADAEQVEAAVGTLTPLSRALAERFWPGPLTLVLPAHPELASLIHRGGGTVAVRVPDHAVARGLAQAARHPVTATSANRSGARPATTADDVIASLGDRISVVLDAGTTRGGLPSTIVDVTGMTAVLVRAGAVPWDRVLESLRE